MAHSPAPSRPPLPHSQPPSFQRDFAQPNGRPSPSPLSAQSPTLGLPFSSPSPQQFNPPQYGQPPAAKRPRLSPDDVSPFTQSFPPTPTGQPTTPAGGSFVNGAAPAPSRPGLMAPPQRPPDKQNDQGYDDILSGTGVNIEEEAQMLMKQDYMYRPPPQSSGSFSNQPNSAGAPGSAGGLNGPQIQSGDGQTPGIPLTPDEVKRREEIRADWEAGRHSQNPLWDMFLMGGSLNDRIRNISIREHLVDPQSGVLINTQKHAPPPMVRVNGLEGASRIIDKGQAILDSGQKGERLAEIMKVIALATKARMTGLISSSAQLAQERQQHSAGRIPDEWKDIAVAAKEPADVPEGLASPAGSTSLKRTLSQANSEPSTSADQIRSHHPFVGAFDKTSTSEKSAEDARRQKRAKRKAASNAEAASNADAAVEALAALDSEKRTTKKERKLAETKFSEQQQHKSANEASRMALGGIGGLKFGGKKQRTYDWMKGGTGSGVSTPGRPALSTTTSAAGTPATDRVARPVPKERHFGLWDETKDSKIQARDVQLVLEGDGRASRSFIRGLSTQETSGT